jgi:uncharacterized protein YndB with AHSA1/START domain
MDGGKASETTRPRNQTTMQLEGDRELIITRSFNARPALVFQAWTDAALVRRWWAPRSRGVSMVRCDADVRVGGTYRYVLRRDDGTGGDLAFSGEYRELTPPSRLVYTQLFEPYPGDPVIVTVTFEDQAGKTRMVSHELYPSAAVRAAVLESGMEHGMRETMDQLDALLPTLG